MTRRSLNFSFQKLVEGNFMYYKYQAENGQAVSKNRLPQDDDISFRSESPARQVALERDCSMLLIRAEILEVERVNRCGARKRSIVSNLSGKGHWLPREGVCSPQFVQIPGLLFFISLTGPATASGLYQLSILYLASVSAQCNYWNMTFSTVPHWSDALHVYIYQT